MYGHRYLQNLLRASHLQGEWPGDEANYLHTMNGLQKCNLPQIHKLYLRVNEILGVGKDYLTQRPRQ